MNVIQLVVFLEDGQLASKLLGRYHVSISEKSLFLLTFIVSLDSLAVGIVGTVNIAFLTSLVSKKYTAFQYALLTGFMTLPGFALKGLSGVWVESFQTSYGFEYGWMSFYIATSLPVWLAPVLSFPTHF